MKKPWTWPHRTIVRAGGMQQLQRFGRAARARFDLRFRGGERRMVAGEEAPAGGRGGVQARLRLVDMLEIENALRPVAAQLHARARCSRRRPLRGPSVPVQKSPRPRSAITSERIEERAGQVIDRRVVIAGRRHDGRLDLLQPVAGLEEFAFACRPASDRRSGRRNRACRVSIASSAASRLAGSASPKCMSVMCMMLSDGPAGVREASMDNRRPWSGLSCGGWRLRRLKSNGSARTGSAPRWSVTSPTRETRMGSPSSTTSGRLLGTSHLDLAGAGDLQAFGLRARRPPGKLRRRTASARPSGA